jgi:hypothetical protein
MSASNPTYHADIVPVEQDFGKLRLCASVITLAKYQLEARGERSVLTTQSHPQAPYLVAKSIAVTIG